MSNTAYKFAGRVVAVGKTERMGRDPSKPFLKRTLVVDDADEGDKYPNPVPFEATGERCAKLDGVKPGAKVEVTFRAKGREWRDPSGNVRHFGSNWIVDVAVKSAGADVPEVPDVPESAVAPSEADALPF
ncbi:MAG: DUF3127 domain-containing protein [Kiritimatiellae bacterium]|nr:DUF3127 domain-containing protein [Kiritimatiellia bacterium]